MNAFEKHGFLKRNVDGMDLFCWDSENISIVVQDDLDLCDKQVRAEIRMTIKTLQKLLQE